MLTLTKTLTDQQAAQAISIDKTMRAKLHDLPHPIVASWDERHRLVIDRGRPWIVGPLEIDPYLTGAGGYPFPAQVGAQLQRISLRGARFHRIALAHELNHKTVPGAVLSKAGPSGVPISAADAKAWLGQAPAAPKPKQLAATMDTTLKKMLRGAGHGAAAAAGLLAVAGELMLDPIVFGVIGVNSAPATGEPAIYYPLAAWHW